MLSQMFAMTSLILLVPLGLVWLGFEVRANRTGASNYTGYRLGLAALIAATLATLIIILSAIMMVGFSLGLIILVLWMLIAARLFARLRARRRGRAATIAPAEPTSPRFAFNPAPLYLIIIPAAAVTLRLTLLYPAADFSRGRAIANAEPLIADIERFRADRGHYPPSLLAVHNDYKLSIIGIDRYQYEPTGDAYNLCFENFAAPFGTQEIVVYNPRGGHDMTSHDMDLLRLSPADLDRQRGYYAVHNARESNWKYFWFD